MVSHKQYTNQEIWSFLSEVLDPEVPVINVVELGIVREVSMEENEAFITITPTYTGCPAMSAISVDIIAKLAEKGISKTHIKTIYSPAWTTDWITEEAKEKLRVYGIAPPTEQASAKIHSLLSVEEAKVTCPRCGSHDTFMKSHFGSTACKALYFCHNCLEPFDYFKCI